MNEQIDKLRQENQRIRDENRVLEKKLAKLQLKHETLSSKLYELKKRDYKTKSMYVQERSVRVRSGPGINYRAVGGRRFGDEILTKDVKGDWHRIVDPIGLPKNHFLDFDGLLNYRVRKFGTKDLTNRILSSHPIL